MPSRILVMGDPQAPFAKVMAVLAHHRALDGERLAREVVLVSMGDYFDYDLRQPQVAGQEGLRVLRWLASHEPAQTVLLFGNHDAARVMELASVSDERFAAAQVLARSIDDLKRSAGIDAASSREAHEFLARFPDVPTYGYAVRDYASFSAEQRALVVELLLAGRFRLAHSGELLDGRPVLLTHAGVTSREVALLEQPARSRLLADALEARLAAAVERCRSNWVRGMITPLSLAPLHVAGDCGEEGGGLLYRQPADLDRPGADRAWELDAARPRRFDPRDLPSGLTQIAGHTGHTKCLHELGKWATPAARHQVHGGIRTLRSHEGEVVYDLGVSPPMTDAGQLILVDGEMRLVAAADYEFWSSPDSTDAICPPPVVSLQLCTHGESLSRV